MRCEKHFQHRDKQPTWILEKFVIYVRSTVAFIVHRIFWNFSNHRNLHKFNFTLRLVELRNFSSSISEIQSCKMTMMASSKLQVFSLIDMEDINSRLMIFESFEWGWNWYLRRHWVRLIDASEWPIVSLLTPVKSQDKKCQVECWIYFHSCLVVTIVSSLATQAIINIHCNSYEVDDFVINLIVRSKVVYEMCQLKRI